MTFGLKVSGSIWWLNHLLMYIALEIINVCSKLSFGSWQVHIFKKYIDQIMDQKNYINVWYQHISKKESDRGQEIKLMRQMLPHKYILYIYTNIAS